MEGIELSKTKVKTLLIDFCDHMLIENYGEGWYLVQRDLRQFMNEEFVETPIPEDSDDDSKSDESAQHSDDEESLLSAISPQTRTMMQNNVVQKTNQRNHDREDVNIVTQETMDMNMSINDDLSISSISFNSEHLRSNESFSFPEDNNDANINMVSQTGDTATQLNDSSIDSPSRGRGNRGYTSKRSRDAGCTSLSESPKKKKNQQQFSAMITEEIVSNIHMRPPNENIVTGSYLVQPHFKRIIYYAKEDERPREIAKKFKVDVKVIVAINKQRQEMSDIRSNSRIRDDNSPIVLPLQDIPVLFTKPSETIVNTIGVGDIPMVNEDDKAVEGSYLVQPHEDRMIYYTHDNETPNQIADLSKVNAKDIVKVNKKREGYGYLRANSRLQVNSPIILPRTLCFHNTIYSI